MLRVIDIKPDGEYVVADDKSVRYILHKIISVAKRLVALTKSGD